MDKFLEINRAVDYVVINCPVDGLNKHMRDLRALAFDVIPLRVVDGVVREIYAEYDHSVLQYCTQGIVASVDGNVGNVLHFAQLVMCRADIDWSTLCEFRLINHCGRCVCVMNFDRCG